MTVHVVTGGERVKVRDKMVSVLVNDLIKSYQTTLPIHYERRQLVRWSVEVTIVARMETDGVTID